MKAWMRWTRRLLLAILPILLIVVGVFYYQVGVPIKQFTRIIELDLQGEEFDPDELRSVTHRVLRWVPHHDAIIAISWVGDSTSVPILIRTLRRVDKPDENGRVIDTSVNCLTVLCNLTGENFGFDAEAWADWYENQSELGPRD